jgi:hypothetical protein
MSVEPAPEVGPWHWVFRFLLGQLGRRSDRQRTFGMVLAAEEIPGSGWTALSHRTTRTVYVPFATNPPRATTAWAKFRQEPEGRRLALHVFRFDSEESARKYVASWRSDTVHDPRVRSVAERKLTGIEILGTSTCEALEREDVRADVHGFHQSIACSTDCVTLLAVGSAIGSTFSMADLTNITTVQVSKIQAHLSDSR